MDETPEELRARATAWFAEHAPTRAADTFDVSVFRNEPHDAERTLIRARQNWIQSLWDAGLAGLAWPTEAGGHGLGQDAQRMVDEVEFKYDTPPTHELVDVTTHLVAPTLLAYGTTEQIQSHGHRFARAEELCVQLFSEPGAGSDLAGLATRAEWRDGEWHIQGQKVWSSGAQFADYGFLLARTDPDAPKHQGITAFLVPMHAPGMSVRPIRQMSGGTSFCEVFVDDVAVSDHARVGDPGAGWHVATTLLSFERDTSGADTTTGGSWADIRSLARDMERADDPLVRQHLADVLIHEILAEVAHRRDAAGDPPAAIGSMRKLQWVTRLHRISRVACELLGQQLAYDSGQPRTFGWTDHVLGAPGYRIAGGTDEIQRTIIAERLLGLPSGPRADRGLSWKDIPR